MTCHSMKKAIVTEPTLRTLVIFLLISTCVSARAKTCDRIQPYPKNPRYWQYEGKPVLLLGGSKDDNLFQVPNLEKHLDLLASVGGNYIRNTMSDRQDHGFEVYPFKRLSNGKYDLNRWNEEYWRRFENLLRWTAERDIIVQIELWDRFDYSQEHWHKSPWRPGNNINYTNEKSGLAEAYPAPAWRDRQPFFHSIAGMRRYKKQYDIVRNFQEQFVAKMLSYSLRHGNVLYCMNNETSTTPQWGRYWMKFITDKACEKGVEVYVTDMFDDVWKPQSSAKLRQAFDDPKVYTFLDISQVNSRSFNEDHWKNLLWIMKQARKHPRPLNHTKIYSAGSTRWGSGTPEDGVERFWRNLLAGSASCRFHRPGAGIGLNEIAQSCIRSARMVESRVKFWDVKPHMELLDNRESDEAYLAADPGEQYILYFTKGGSVKLDLSKHKDRSELRWLSIHDAEWGHTEAIQSGANVTINAPGREPWVAVITKK